MTRFRVSRLSRETASLALALALVGGFLFSASSLQPARASDDATQTRAPTVRAISTEILLLTETPALEPSATPTLSIDLTPVESLTAIFTETPAGEADTPTPLPVKTGRPSNTPTPDVTSPVPPEGTESPTPTPNQAGPTHTPTLYATPTMLATATATATPDFLLPLAGSVVINEVAWGGTAASGFDEWIELYNPGAAAVDLTGWTLSDGGDITITLAGTMAAGGYFLLERTDDTTIGDIPADQIYTGGLNNAGETLTLRDSGANVVDTANGDGGPWPAGSGPPTHASMERLSATSPDTDTNWQSNNGVNRNGLDAAGNPINGTPRQSNSPPLPPTPTPTPPAYPPLAILINEVAWAGTAASSFDEWIELYNPGATALDLSGWTLSDGGDLNLTFPAVTVGPNGFLLLERTDDSTVSDILADVIYTGGLNNAGETLTLRDSISNVVDTANGDGGPWPGGSDVNYASMERLSAGPDGDGNWQGNNGFVRNGLDAAGNSLRATARSANSSNFPTPTPAPYPAGVLLNEFLPHPGAGAQEFIEVINLSAETVDLSGWQLDDIEGGTSPHTLPPGTLIGPSALLVFYRDTTGIALNDDGDTARLLRLDGSVADEWSYDRDPGVEVSWARIPDGGSWNGRGIPTPGQSNRAEAEPAAPAATPIPIGVFRAWPDGAWVTVVARVSVPPLVFGTRTIHIQDDTGGIAVYLGRGDWPPMVVGQSITLLGYLRHQSGNLQLYVRNLWHVGVGSADDIVPAPPLAASTGQIGEATEGALVKVTGRVVRLEEQAFWIDDGSGAARVFFSAYTGLSRPPVRRDEVWMVTGAVVEYTTARSVGPGLRLQPRFAADVAQLTAALLSLTPEPIEVFAEPPATEEPTATPEP